jgi:hypothetical protein
MSLSTLRDPQVILTDHTVWSQWYQQLQIRCTTLKIWEQVSPDGNIAPRVEPVQPVEPDVGSFEGRTTLGLDDDGNRLIPTNLSELSVNGLKAWREEIEQYKVRLETYKTADRKYQEESASMDKLMVLLQNTVSSHLMKTCCRPGESFRTWITALKDTVGIDDEEERERARDRYLLALKPMKQPTNWDTWLIEYDHAASTAEAEKVAEVQNIQDVMRDFLRAIMKVAPTWEVTFKENGRREKGMTRRQMMKRFREHMSDHYPVKGKQQRAAFAASGVSFPADGGESTQGAERDASRAADDASSASTTQGGRGRPQKKRNFGQTTTSKQSSTEDTAAAGGKVCPACGQRHRLDKCYYVYKDKAPEWFVPRSGTTMMVSWRLEHDADLQELIRGEKRSRANGNNTSSVSATSTK